MKFLHAVMGAVLGCGLGSGVALAQPAAGAVGEPTQIPVLLPGRPSAIEMFLGPPQVTEDLWRVLDRDVAYGQTERALQLLDQLYDRKDLTPEMVLSLREKYGSALFLRLNNNPKLRQPAQKLIDMANQAAQEKARSEDRIRHFLANLSKSPSEQAYAIAQLRKAGPHALPIFVEELQKPAADKSALTTGLLAMPANVWPAAVAVLSSDNVELIGLMVELLDRLQVPQSAAGLWYVAADPDLPAAIHDQARGVLAKLTRTPLSKLPTPYRALTELATAAYRQQARSEPGDSETQMVWVWRDGGLVEIPMRRDEALDWFGLKYAQQALRLNPEYAPAKRAFLQLALWRDSRRFGAAQTLDAQAESVWEAAISAGPTLLSEVLHEAMAQGRTPVVLGAVRGLGQTGSRNLVYGTGTRPGLLLSALHYPDLRVQLAAADAILRLQPPKRFAGSAMVIDVLARALEPNTAPIAVVVDGDAGRGNRTVGLLEQLGYAAKQAISGQTGFERATAGPVQLIVVQSSIGNWDLRDTIANLRADVRTRGVPIVIFAPADQVDGLRHYRDHYPRVLVTPTLDDADQLAKALQAGLAAPLADPLTEEERQWQQQFALDAIVRLAQGEMSYFDLTPLGPVLSRWLYSPELGPRAAEALGAIPSAAHQKALAAVLLDERQTPANRVAMAQALAVNIQRGGCAIPADTQRAVIGLLEQGQESALQLALARLAGTFNPQGAEIARLLQRYTPKVEPAAPPQPPPTEESGDKQPMGDPGEMDPPESSTEDQPPANGQQR